MSQSTNALRARARRLKLVAFDVDGVMTDGRLYYGANGEEFKVFNSLDGHGLKMLSAAGITLAIITGRNSAMVSRHATHPGIEHVTQGHEDKGPALQTLAAELKQEADVIGYVGDDVPDVVAMEWATLSFSVANGHPQARACADKVTEARGGEGAVRESCDFILGAHPESGQDN